MGVPAWGSRAKTDLSKGGSTSGTESREDVGGPKSSAPVLQDRQANSVHPPPARHLLIEFLDRHVGPGPWQAELVAKSSNYVYRCDGPAGSVAIRTPRVGMERPPAFWRQMREVFGLGFPPSPSQFRAVSSNVRGAGLMSPELLVSGHLDGRPVFVTTWLSGQPWGPDQFPGDTATHRDLGSFLARMHQRAYEGFGVIDGQLRPTSSYFDVAVESARATLEAHWSGSDSVLLLDVISRCDPERISSSCSLVMPDIAANQFLFGPAGITGVVDLDSYVVGPIEMELTIAEWCLVNPDAFAEGYESVRPLPSFEPFRLFHRATMLVNEPDLTGDIERLLQEKVYFD